MIYAKSYYSLLSSMLSPEDIINYAFSLSEKACFLVDTNLYGAMYFYKKCISKKIKPIIGLHVILKDFSLCLYAKNYEGYKSLIKLSTIQNERVVTFSDLEKYNRELLCVVDYSNRNFYNKLKKLYSDIYLGYSNKEEMYSLQKITDQIVFFRECLYLNSSDSEYLSYLYRIRDGKTISDTMKYDVLDHELNIKGMSSFTDLEYLKNIDDIISKCNLSFPDAELLLPIYDTPNGVDTKTYLFELSKLGLKKRLGSQVNDLYKKRLSHELQIIDEMGFCNYFLVVYDFILYAKKNNILVGPGRGSAAGSLVAYCLGITEIDPLKYDLLFERFLNPERKTMPDIDTDFPDDRRDEVIRYVQKKYGEKRVAGIVTFGTLSSKQVLRDVARVLNIPVYKVDSLTKLIPMMNKDSLLSIYKKNSTFKSMIDNDLSFQKLFKIALKFEGMPRHTSSHAAGIVMCRCDLDEVLPLTVSDDMYLTSYSMEYLEELGLLKMDFLGLKNLSILSHILEDIEKTYHKKISFNSIHLEDEQVLRLFERADTTGIFQFESSGMRSFLKQLRPNSFEDIFAAIALFRPGPAINIPTYIKRKHLEEEIIYPDPSLEKILKNTYGIIIYQEQIMQVASVYAGYTLGEADILRRAMSKKKMDVLKSEEEHFLKKSKEMGHDLKTSKEIFDLILNFALYGFNRSHSVAYSLIAYKLAYFKVYYKEIFYSNLLSSVIGSAVKSSEYILEAKSKDIQIEKPDIFISSNRYLVFENKIYAPFSIINNIGEVATRQIIAARGDKPFSDIYDCFSRLILEGVGKKVLESLILAHAFRSFHYNVQTLISYLDELYDYGCLTKDLDPTLVMKPILKEETEFIFDYLLENEKKLFGFYLTGHPTSKYLLENNDVLFLKDIFVHQNKNKKFLVFVEKIKTIKTKKGENMAFITASDETGRVEFILFPNVYTTYAELLRGDIIKVDGKIEKRLRDLQIIVNHIKILNGDLDEN